MGGPVEADELMCDFCPTVSRTGGFLASPILGPYQNGKRAKMIYIHAVCARWAPDIHHDPDTTDLLVGVSSAYYRSRRLTCAVCMGKGATVGCFEPTCPNVYHYCCLYGTTPPVAYTPPCARVGPCLRLDDLFAAFCPTHVGKASDKVLVRQMREDADRSSFLRSRAAAVAAAQDGDPGMGTDCPNFDITGIRRNETETIFSRVWGVASDVPDNKSLTAAGRLPHHRVVRQDEQLPGPATGAPVPAVGRASVTAGLQEAGGSAADEAGGQGAAEPEGAVGLSRNPFLLRNMRGSPAVDPHSVRRSLPAVPSSFLNTTVVEAPVTVGGRLPSVPTAAAMNDHAPSAAAWHRPVPVEVRAKADGSVDSEDEQCDGDANK